MDFEFGPRRLFWALLELGYQNLRILELGFEGAM